MPDPQVLFDPFEKELDLPAAAIQVGDAQCGQGELFGQEYEALVGLGIDALDATERNGKPFVRIVTTQDHRLIANQTGQSIDRMRVASIGFEIRFRARHEETARLVQPMQPLEVEITSIHHVIRLPDISKFASHIALQQDFALTNDLTGVGEVDASYVGSRVGIFQPTALRQVYPWYTQTNLRTGVNYKLGRPTSA